MQLLIDLIVVLVILFAAISAAYVMMKRPVSIKGLLELARNLGQLIVDLSKDERVPKRVKISLGLIGAYLASPIDLIPDFIPFLGYLDDLIAASLALDAILNQIDKRVVLSHWHGDMHSFEAAAKTSRYLSVIVPRSWKKKIFGPVEELDFGPGPDDRKDD